MSNIPIKHEVLAIAKWVALRGGSGRIGELLPIDISSNALNWINKNVRKFQKMVKDARFSQNPPNIIRDIENMDRGLIMMEYAVFHPSDIDRIHDALIYATKSWVDSSKLKMQDNWIDAWNMFKRGMKERRTTRLNPRTIKRPIPLKGGLSEGRYSTEFNQKQLKMGIKVEMEHTKDKKIAKMIALDHLAEIPDYYTRLAKMEKEAKRKVKRKNIKKS